MPSYSRRASGSDQRADGSGDVVRAPSEVVPASGQGGDARRPNLPFRFDPSALDKLQPRAMGTSIRSVLNPGSQGQRKDGSSYSDSEKLFLAVDVMVRHGLRGDQLEHAVAALFFDGGRPSQGRDEISQIHFDGSRVQIDFRSPGGYAFNQGAIIPRICTRPASYDGADTNTRGSQVRRYQDTGENLPTAGSFRQRNAQGIEDGFLASEEGAAFAALDQASRQADPSYLPALNDYTQQIVRDYLIKGTQHIKDALGSVDGRSPQEVLKSALDAALSYTNPYVHATAHSALELQDEAIVQRALDELGYDVNVDTDDPENSAIVERGG